MKKDQADKTKVPEMKDGEMELLAGKFYEELSDGGERNKMAEEQLKRITTD